MTSIYDMISLVTFSLAAICLATAVFFWFRFHIREIIGDLTGRTAKKTIEQMRTENEKSGKKSYRPTPIAAERGTKTEMIVRYSQDVSKEQKTEKLSNVTESGATELLSGATELLDSSTELSEEYTTRLEPIKKFEDFVMIQNIVITHTNVRI